MNEDGESDAIFKEFLNSDDNNCFIVDSESVLLSQSVTNCEAEPQKLPEIANIVEYLLSPPDTGLTESEETNSTEFVDLNNDSLAQLLYSWGLLGELYSIFKGNKIYIENIIFTEILIKKKGSPSGTCRLISRTYVKLAIPLSIL